MPNYFVVRTNRAGVFFGKIRENKGTSIILEDVRKLFYWEGATAVEGLATLGVKKPEKCKFTVFVKEMEVSEPIQIIPCTDEAEYSLKNVKVWTI